jgi:hypothetical protein
LHFEQAMGIQMFAIEVFIKIYKKSFTYFSVCCISQSKYFLNISKKMDKIQTEFHKKKNSSGS